MVPQARKPGARFDESAGLGGAGTSVKGKAGLQTVPVKGPAWVPGVGPLPGMVARSLTTMEVGVTPVRVFPIKSVRALRCTSAFGVTRQEQHAISCSSGEKA